MSDRTKRAIDWVFLLGGLIAVWAIPHRISGDGEVRYESLARLLTTGSHAIPRYSILGPLFASPLFFLGQALGDPRGMTAHFNALLLCGALVLFFRELRVELGSDRARAALVLLVFATMLPNHVQVFYGEVFTALTIALGVFWLSRSTSPRTTIGAWIAIVFGAINTPGVLVGVGLVAIRTALRRRSVFHLAAPILAFVLISLENLWARGAIGNNGYLGDVGPKTSLPYSGIAGFSFPFFFGVLAILFSFGKGLVFFTPGLFLPLARDASERLRWVRGTLALCVAGLVFVYARWWAWHGNWFWGPRFFLLGSILGAIVLATHLGPSRGSDGARASRVWPFVLAGVLALSFWVGVDGLVFDTTGLEFCTKNGCELEGLCNLTPEWSALWHPFVDFASTVPPKTRPLALGVCAFWAIAFAWTARGWLSAAFDVAKTWTIALVRDGLSLLVRRDRA